MEDIKIPVKFEDLFNPDESMGEYGFPSDINDLDINHFEFQQLIAQFEEYLEEETEEAFIFQFHTIQTKTGLTMDKQFILALRNLPILSSELHAATFDALLELSKFAIDYLSRENCVFDLSDEAKIIFKKIFYYYVVFLTKMEQYSYQKNADVTDGKAKKASKKAKTSSKKVEFEWNHDCRATALNVLADMLSTPFFGAIWTMGMIDENFLNNINQYLLVLLENKIFGGTSSEDISLRQMTQSIIVKTLSFYDSNGLSTIVVSMITSLTRFEHMALLLSDLCAKESLITRRQFLTRELLHEMSGMILQTGESNNNGGFSLTNATIKNVSIFIENYSKLDAKNMIALFFSSSSLLTLLGCSAHQLRSSVIQAMGYVIMAINQVTSTGNGLEDIFSPAELVKEAEEEQESETKEDTEVKPEPSEDNDNEEEANKEKSSLKLSKEEQIKRLSHQREDLLTLLLERKLDVNPYTRANVLKMMIQLVEKEVIPLSFYLPVTEMAASRLLDRNALVRKYAIALMTALIENNPFSSILKKEIFETKFKSDFAHEEILSEGGIFYRTAIDFIGLIEKVLESQLISFLKSKNASDITETLTLFSTMVNFNISEAMLLFRETFALIFHQDVSIQKEVLLAFVTVYFLNGSKESMVSIPSTDSGEIQTNKIGKMQYLALSSKEMAYNLVKLLTICSREELLCVEEILKKLMTVGNSSATTPSALELAIASLNLPLTANHWKEITQYSYQFLLKFAEQSEVEQRNHCRRESQQRRQSSMLLSLADRQKALSTSGKESMELMSLMGASVTVISIVLSAVQSQECQWLTLEMIEQMVELGLRKAVMLDRNHIDQMDFDAMKATATVIQIAFGRNHSHSFKPTPTWQRLCEESLQVLTEVIMIIPTKLTIDTMGSWYAVCEECIHTIYQISTSPDAMMEFCIKGMWDYLSRQEVISSELMSAFLFVIGQTAIDTLVAVERVGKAMKQHLLANVTTTTTTTTTAKNTAHEGNKKQKETQSEPSDEGAIDDFEEQMGIAQAVDADFEMEMLQLTEMGLVTANTTSAVTTKNTELLNLLGQFLPLLKFIVANETKEFSNVHLRTAAIIALCRYMSVSAIVCEEHLSLIFTILSSVPDVTDLSMNEEDHLLLKTTILIALGDLAFRFPNVLEPWTSHFYARLSDTNAIVRYNALMVITHLVLNDMIKVKGQISSIAFTLVDEEENIRKLSRLFFLKLSERSNNPLYNLLGDIISNLSHHDAAITQNHPTEVDNQPTVAETGVLVEEKQSGLDLTLTALLPSHAVTMASRKKLSNHEFETIMHFLLSFIHKDKHADSLLERLLIRLSMAETTKQRQNLAFCISELSVSEKGLKKLLEMIKNIKPALQDTKVFESFKTLLSKAKRVGSKAATNDDTTTAPTAATSAPTEKIATAIITEVENALQEAIQENTNTIDEENTLKQEDSVTGNAAPVKGKKKTISKTKTGGKEKAPTKGGRSTKAAATNRKKAKQVYSSDEDEDLVSDEDEEDDDDEMDDRENQDVSRQNIIKSSTAKASSKGKAMTKSKAAVTTATTTKRRNNRVIIAEDEEEY